MSNKDKNISVQDKDDLIAENRVKQDVQEFDFADPNFGPSGEPWSNQVPNIAKSYNLEKYPSGYIIEPPTDNPTEIYEERSENYPYQQIGLKEKWSQIPPEGQGVDRIESLGKMESYYSYQRQQFIGYQVIQQFDISKDLSPFLNMNLNNIGDPFQDGYFTVNAKQAERGVLDFYASLWHAQWPSLPKPSIDDAIGLQEYFGATEGDLKYLESEAYKRYKESYWGYILSMGSTEGNLYAVLAARDYLSGFSLVSDRTGDEEALCPPSIEEHLSSNKYTPVAFYSKAAHYSLAKSVHAMQVKTFYQIAMENMTIEPEKWVCPLEGDWPVSVPNNNDGSVNIEALVKLVDFFAKRGYPPFICFNYGTTFKGAYDDIPEACAQLKLIFEKYGLEDREVEYFDFEGKLKKDHRRGYWIHVDGALGASLMPFVEMSVEHGKTDKKDLAPCFDFRIDEVMSIVTSGHKWPSAPAPTGVYMTKNKYLITPVATPDYLGSADTTFAGSRSGLSAMAMWNLIADQGIPGFVKRAEHTMELCNYTEKKLIELQGKLNEEAGGKGFDIWFQRAPNGGTSFIFRKPVDEIMYKYSLPIEVAKTGTTKRTYVHLFIFWDRDKAMIDSLIKALGSISAFAPEAEKPIEPSTQNKQMDNYIKLLGRTVHKGFR